MTNQDAIEITKIQHTPARYNHCADTADMAGVAATVTDDGALKIPGMVFAGIAEVRGFYDGRLENARQELQENRRPRHYITTSQIDVRGSDAGEGKTYFLLIRTGTIEQQGAYFDRYRKVGDEWRIAYRNVVLHFMA